MLLKVWLWKYYGHNCKILGETNCPSILLYVMAQWDTCYCQWQSMMVTIRMIKIFVYFVLVLESQLPTLTFSHCGHSLTGVVGGGRAWNFQVFFNLYRTNVQMGFDHWVANFQCQHVFNVDIVHLVDDPLVEEYQWTIHFRRYFNVEPFYILILFIFWSSFILFLF